MKKSKLSFWVVFVGIVSLAMLYATNGSAVTPPACEDNTNPAIITPGCWNQFAVLCNAPVQAPPIIPLSPSTATYGANMSVGGPDGSVGGIFCNLNFGNFGTVISGNVAASGFGFTNRPLFISGLPANSVAGECATDGGSIVSANACAGGETTDNSSPILAVPGPLLNATVDEECYDDTLACQSPTVTMDAISVRSRQTQTISTTVPGGLTIISTPQITVAPSATLMLSGGSNDQLVLETPGTIQLGTSARIVLSGGLSAGNVLITTVLDPVQVPGSNSRTNVGASSTIDAEFHAEGGCVIGTNVTVDGALTCDFGTNVGSGFKIYHIPNQIKLTGCASRPAACDFLNTIGG